MFQAFIITVEATTDLSCSGSCKKGAALATPLKYNFGI